MWLGAEKKPVLRKAEAEHLGRRNSTWRPSGGKGSVCCRKSSCSACEDKGGQSGRDVAGHMGLAGHSKEELGSHSEYSRKPMEHFSQRIYVSCFSFLSLYL